LNNQIYNYLNTHIDNDGDYEEEALNFVSAVIDELTDTCEIDFEVDFPEKVILHNSVINNQKAKCVYDKLKEMSNTIFSDIINDHFGSSKNAHIRFEIGTTPNGEDAITNPFINNPSDVSSSSAYKIVINSAIVEDLSLIEIALIYIHESIHAELFERCFRLGLIQTITFVNGSPKVFFTSNPTIPYDIPSSIFNALTTQYYNNGQNSQWNHDLFTALNYQEQISENLENIHPWLNDQNNDFVSNINNDPFNVGGNYTLSQLMDYISWIGLEGTQEYANTFLGPSNVSELSKLTYIEDAISTKYTQECND
jgi:hypothetical protein